MILAKHRHRLNPPTMKAEDIIKQRSEDPELAKEPLTVVAIIYRPTVLEGGPPLLASCPPLSHSYLLHFPLSSVVLVVGGRELAQAFSPYVRRADVHDSLTNSLLHPVFRRRMDRRGEGGKAVYQRVHLSTYLRPVVSDVALHPLPAPPRR